MNFMDSVINFLKILILGKSITVGAGLQVLGPTWTTIHPEQLLTSVTGGASFTVELSVEQLGVHAGVVNRNSLLTAAQELFPPGTLIARAENADGDSIIFNDGNYSVLNDRIKLILNPSRHIPENWTINKIEIKSTVLIESHALVWQNYYL